MNPDDQGYDEERFLNAVDRNFHCPICMNVLKKPVQCRRKEHYYCTPCITRHLVQYSQTCPMCKEALTVEILKEPSRIVMNYLSPLMIRCDNASRGCHEVVELGLLKTHVENCNFLPVACSVNGCSMIIDKQDKEFHETQLCGYRIVKCDDCGEEIQQRKYKVHGCVMRKEVDGIKISLMEMKDQLQKLTRKTDEAQCAQGKMMKEVRIMIAEMKEEMKKMTKEAPFDLRKAIIVVAGGNDGKSRLKSAEMFSWVTRAWVPLPPMKEPRSSLSSFVCENQIIVSGGYSGNSWSRCMQKMNMDEEPKRWVDFPAKLPFKGNRHSNVIYENRLIIMGGYNGDKGKLSDGIYEVLVTPLYTSKLLCRMPQPRWGHGAALFNDKILIVGGKTGDNAKDSLESVLSYDVNENKCEHIASLPYAVSFMATVSYEDNLVVIGGYDKNGNALNKVCMYNINRGEFEMLPNMNVKRAACTAVTIGNVIVVMGGICEEGKYLSSVECFSFERYVWDGLPPMIEPRSTATSAVKIVV